MSRIARIVDTGPDRSMPPGVPYPTGFIEYTDGRRTVLTTINHERASWKAAGERFEANEAYRDSQLGGFPTYPKGDHGPGGLYDTKGT